MSMAIVTLTMNPAVDAFVDVDRVTPAKKLRCSSPRYGAGGGGINVSRAIKRLGGESMAMFPAGGAAGEMLVTSLTRDGIAVDVIRSPSPTRENLNVHETSTGQEYRFIVPGPKIGIDEWKHCLRALHSIEPAPKFVVASGSLPPGVPVDFFGKLAVIARERGFRLIVDTSGEPLRHIRHGTFLLKPNVAELAYIGGQHGMLPQAMIEQAARAIVAAGRAEAILVSAGAAGATLVNSGGSRRFLAPAVPIESRIGAGDSMVAGIVVALARGWSLDDAVRYGVAAGSSAVMAHGHLLCTRETTEMLYAQVREEALATA